MPRQLSDNVEITRWFVYFVDVIAINALYLFCHQFDMLPWNRTALLLWNIAYLISIFIFPPVAQNRLAKSETVIRRASSNAWLMAFIFATELIISRFTHFYPMRFLVSILILVVLMVITRMLTRSIIKLSRRHGRNSRSVVFVGAGVNLRGLYDVMTESVTTGFQIRGYFENQESQHLGNRLTRLGTLDQVIPWLDSHPVEMLFCNLPSSQSQEILKIMEYCENHLIRFYSVPNVRNYVHHSMQVEFVGDTPVLSLRIEPLRYPINRIIKRTFDIVVSLLVLFFILPWVYLVVAIVTKRVMPGPVLFLQKRHGYNGQEFTLYKFRSMKINDKSDTLQATKNDPRKTQWGDFLRRTNIDELPQFINVLLGDMSIVGPRPHMLRHTEEYSALIKNYMVRHFAKPGITGWAQVTGSRGETSELWQMEQRVEKDIWYIENWSFLLDLHIIVMTIANVLGHEKGNAY